MISAVILTKNEERNIERCINSLLLCDEIIVVDDYSEDRTINIIQNAKFKMQNYNAKIKIYKRHLEGDFAGQRNFGLEKATGEWTLFVDADEIISEELKKEILSICHPELISGSRSRIKFGMTSLLKPVQHDVIGFYLKRKDYFLGKWLKYGETGNIRLLRLAKKESGRWRGRVHEIWDVKGRTIELKNPLLHYPHQSITEFLKELNIYTDLVAQYWKEQGKEVMVPEIVLNPLGKFLHNYFVKLGFLDGGPGLIMALMMSFHSFLVRGKLWLATHHE